MAGRHDGAPVTTTHLAANTPIGTVADEHVEARPAEREKSPSILIVVFILSLALPFTFFFGPLRLSPYRMLLITLFVPCVFAWLSGACGKIRSPDIYILFYCLWAAVAMLINHGTAFAVEPAGILLIETFGTYLLARWLIRDARSFLRMVRVLVGLITFIIPFALYEALTGTALLLEIFRKIYTSHLNEYMDPRWGLDRVQGTFAHPILFGVFCSSGFSLSIYVLGYGKNFFQQLLRASPSMITVFLSLSSGPLSALTAQMGIIAWDRALKNFKYRWNLFLGCFVFMYVAIDLLSNRTPIKVLIHYFAFNAHTAYNRIKIWDYGSAEVLRHPVFGIGFNEWVRAWYMSASMDMFWLIHAVRYGLPAAILFSLAVAVILIGLSRIQTDDARLLSYRTGYIITMGGLCLAGWTVHFWNEIYATFMFLLGSGVWMLDTTNKPVAEDKPDTRGVIDGAGTRT